MISIFVLAFLLLLFPSLASGQCAVFDACDVCGGDGSTCRDCAGIPNGSSVYDVCNICGGDGRTCRDCRDIPNGPTVYDACDVCAGNGSTCRDCRGIPNGSSVYDACDVCGGDGSTCGACCTDGRSCSSIQPSSCPAGQYFVPNALSCSSDSCCPRASSSFACPTTSHSTKLIVYVDEVGTLQERTVCVNGWLNTDTSTAAGTVATRTLSVTSSDGSFEAAPQTYSCAFGSANAATGFPSSFQCTVGVHEILYTDCAHFCVSASGACTAAKRQSTSVVGSHASFSLASASSDDPHLRGANGAMYDFGGQRGGIYALFSSPLFAVNMQLSAAGPNLRFMTRMGVLVGNTSVAFDHSFNNRDLVMKQLASVGATTTFVNNTLTMTLCGGDHVLTFAAHSDTKLIKYLNFAISVPGCHDNYDGALGVSYRCKFVLKHAPFVWSSAREETFRVKAINAPSGQFSSHAQCALEDEVQGGRLHGTSV